MCVCIVLSTHTMCEARRCLVALLYRLVFTKSLKLMILEAFRYFFILMAIRLSTHTEGESYYSIQIQSYCTLIQLIIIGLSLPVQMSKLPIPNKGSIRPSLGTDTEYSGLFTSYLSNTRSFVQLPIIKANHFSLHMSGGDPTTYRELSTILTLNYSNHNYYLVMSVIIHSWFHYLYQERCGGGRGTGADL